MSSENKNPGSDLQLGTMTFRLKRRTMASPDTPKSFNPFLTQLVKSGVKSVIGRICRWLAQRAILRVLDRRALFGFQDHFYLDSVQHNQFRNFGSGDTDRRENYLVVPASALSRRSLSLMTSGLRRPVPSVEDRCSVTPPRRSARYFSVPGDPL